MGFGVIELFPDSPSIYHFQGPHAWHAEWEGRCFFLPPTWTEPLALSPWLLKALPGLLELQKGFALLPLPDHD